jgi:hypothetical protein
MSSYAISGRRKECIQVFIALVSAVWARGKCLSFCCKDFLGTFLNFRFMFMSIFNSTVQSVPYESNNMRQARQCRRLNHGQSVRHWLMQCKRIQWHVCSAKNKENRMTFKCQECNIGLCAALFFEVYHQTAFLRNN